MRFRLYTLFLAVLVINLVVAQPMSFAASKLSVPPESQSQETTATVNALEPLPCPETVPSVALPPPGGPPSLHIGGPAEGRPADTMTFRLFDGNQQVSADQWQQELNPDRYVGNDYVSSFCLSMSPQPDGSATVVAPAPGRYKIRAQFGGSWIAAYVLVRPPSPALPVRGLAVLGNGPLDRKVAAAH